MQLRLQSIITVTSIVLATILPFSLVFANEKCVNSPLRFTLNTGRAPKCEDIGYSVLPRKCRQSYVASHCPATCDKCRKKRFRCADSAANFINAGRVRNCEWLRNLNERKMQKRCNEEKIKHTCRETCDYCNGEKDVLRIDFDEIDLYNEPYYANYTNEYIHVHSLVAYFGKGLQSYHPETPGISEIVVSEPNAATQWSSDAIVFACPSGTFNLKSFFANSIFGNTTNLTIAGYDQNGNLVDEEIVHFDDDRARYVQLPDSFEGIYAAAMYPSDPLPMGYDNIEMVINSPCFQNGKVRGEDSLVQRLESSGGYFFDSFFV